MLNLARKPEQVVTIGDEIEIVVLRSSTGKVELGIVAPPELRIGRGDERVLTKPKPRKKRFK